MTFLTSVFLGLSMGAGAVFSIYQGWAIRPPSAGRQSTPLPLILAVTLVWPLAVYL